MIPFENNNMTLNISLPPNLSIEEIERREFVETELPVTIYLILLSLIGTIGNMHAIFVYYMRYKPSNHRIFVVWLAVVDVIACSLSIPFELVDIRFNQTFNPDADIVCRCFRYLNHFVSVSSGTLLGVIAVERFRKVCRPFGRQLSQTQSKLACFITVLVSLLLSFPAVIMYGVETEEVKEYPHLVGTDCTVLDKYKKNIVFRGYNVFLLLISTVVFVLCVVIYTIVGRVLLRQYKFRSKSQCPTTSTKDLSSGHATGTNNRGYCPEQLSNTATKKMTLTSDTNGSGNKKSKQPKRAFSEEESSVGRMTSNEVHHVEMKNKPRLDRSKQITLMFLVATAVSYLGYLPYLFLTIIRAGSKPTYNSISQTIGPLNDILVRGYFINNATNPLVYCFLDARFRHECKEFYKKLFHRCKR